MINDTKDKSEKEECYSSFDPIDRLASTLNSAYECENREDVVKGLQMALKECDKTELWVKNSFSERLMSREFADKILFECGAIRKYINAYINSAQDIKD